jgi:hypothetical protein
VIHVFESRTEQNSLLNARKFMDKKRQDSLDSIDVNAGIDHGSVSSDKDKDGKGRDVEEGLEVEYEGEPPARATSSWTPAAKLLSILCASTVFLSVLTTTQFIYIIAKH